MFKNVMMIKPYIPEVTSIWFWFKFAANFQARWWITAEDWFILKIKEATVKIYRTPTQSWQTIDIYDKNNTLISTTQVSAWEYNEYKVMYYTNWPLAWNICVYDYWTSWNLRVSNIVDIWINWWLKYQECSPFPRSFGGNISLLQIFNMYIVWDDFETQNPISSIKFFENFWSWSIDYGIWNTTWNTWQISFLNPWIQLLTASLSVNDSNRPKIYQINDVII